MKKEIVLDEAQITELDKLVDDVVEEIMHTLHVVDVRIKKLKDVLRKNKQG